MNDIKESPFSPGGGPTSDSQKGLKTKVNKENQRRISESVGGIHVYFCVDLNKEVSKDQMEESDRSNVTERGEKTVEYARKLTEHLFNTVLNLKDKD